MITIHLEKRELWDDEHNQFVYLGPDEPLDLTLEHSLVSLYKWESKYHKSYLDTEKKSLEESLDYMAMMVVGEYEDKVDKEAFKALSQKDIERLDKYIKDPMTATTISEKKHQMSRMYNNEGEGFVTAELIYYWMSALNIPFECDRWHLNKLLTLVRLCAIKSNPDENKKKKLTSADLAARRARMEAARAKYKH